MSTTDWSHHRRDMVKLLKDMGIQGNLILSSMGIVERHLFVPEFYRFQRTWDPYGNYPLPIGYDQTISQPYVAAYMLEKLKLAAGDKVLEIGSGSGYLAAVLHEMGVEVFAIEIVPDLYCMAGKVLSHKIHQRLGDGYAGWPEYAPFDAIVVSCAPESIPDTLVSQLKDRGRMILPVGTENQRLTFLNKEGGQIISREDLPVRFVPMVHSKRS